MKPQNRKPEKALKSEDLCTGGKPAFTGGDLMSRARNEYGKTTTNKGPKDATDYLRMALAVVSK